MTASNDSDQALARKKWLFRLSLFATAFAVLVVVLGAFTRLADAGLGCPDWPGCYGHLTWPTSAEDVAKAEALFPETPVEHDKTWPEMVHRQLAGTLGLIILALAIMAYKAQSIAPSLPKKLPIFLVGLVIVQAAFGMWTVTLKLWPQVVTAHLLGGFATLSLIWLMVQRCSNWHWSLGLDHCNQVKSFKMLALLAMLFVIVQIALGGWTSSNYAAMACPDLPTCHGVFWPQADYLQGFNFFQKVGPNYLGGLLDNHARTAIHMGHRIGALVVTSIVLLLIIRLWLSRIDLLQRWAKIIALLLVFQIGLGLSNIIWVLPLPVAVAHNAFGAFLLLSLVALNHRIRTVQYRQA